MAKIEVGRFSQLLRRYLSMAGVVEVAQELAPEISPVFILESEKPSWEFLKGQKLIAASFTVSSVALLPSTARIRNPANSGMLMEVDGVVISRSGVGATSAWQIFLNTQLVDLLTVFPLVPVSRDTRFPALVKQSGTIMSGDNVVGVGSSVATGFLVDSTTVFIPLKAVITPGNSIDITAEAAEENLRGALWWTERRLAPDEL